MLRLHATEVDICRTSKLLGRHRLKSSITGSTIIIYADEIPDNVVEKLFEYATIIGAQNYQQEDSYTSPAAEENSTIKQTDDVEKDSTIMQIDDVETNSTIMQTEIAQEDSTVFVETSPKKVISKAEMVNRGEVYKWGDVKEDEEGERAIKECVIIIQTDYQNSASEDTIALFCTTHYEERSPINFEFQLTSGTMLDHSSKRLGVYNRCNYFIGRIKGIKRSELGDYLGTMNSSFMNTLQPTIDFCLGLKRSRTVNWAQLKMLATVSMNDLFAVSEAKVDDETKVQKFLELFSFDMNANGAEYVKDAIIIASQLGDYTLEHLALRIAQEKDIEASEVLRLIVARVKENFSFKQSPAISFVRLIVKLLKKG